MTIEYDLTEQDYLNFCLYHSKNSTMKHPYERIVRYYIRIATIIILGLIMAIAIITSKPWIYIAGALAYLALMLVFVACQKSSRKKYFATRMREAKYVGPRKFTLNEDCIESEDQHFYLRCRYNEVERISLDKTAFTFILAHKAHT